MHPRYAEWEELLSNWLINAFSSNLNDLVSLYPYEMPFRIEIKKGVEKPYFYKDGEGFNAKGGYVRVGSSKRVASFDEIQRMIFQSKSHTFEKLACNKSDLTFEYVRSKFDGKGIEFDKYGMLIMTIENGYNNAGLFLSDQNPTVSKFAVFQGLSVDTFLDKKEFSGSIMKQLDEI